MTFRDNPTMHESGSGEVAGKQVATAKPEEQTVARQSAGTHVKSPSASASGFTTFPLTTAGADGHAPSFSATISPLEVALLSAEAEEREQDSWLRQRQAEQQIQKLSRAGVQLDAIRRLRDRADRADRRFRLALWWSGTYAAACTLAVLWMVTR